MIDHIAIPQTQVTKSRREMLLSQKAMLIWFTGLSGSGKSTLANRLEIALNQCGYKTYILDGDTIRSSLNSDLTFSKADRIENIRRIGEVSKLFIDAGLIVLSAFISPFAEDRQRVQETVGADSYIEVFVDAPLEVCEQRDVKGLYKKARSGSVKHFTGIDSPYERPSSPDLHLQTHILNIDDAVTLLLDFVLPRIIRK